MSTFAESVGSWLCAASWQLALLVCLVGLTTRLMQAASPQFLHGLWLLVLVKAFLPTNLTLPWSVSEWAITPLAERVNQGAPLWSADWSASLLNGPAGGEVTLQNALGPSAMVGLSLPAILAILWACGGFVFLAAVVWRYRKLVRAIDGSEPIEEGPTRVLLEQIALELGLSKTPDLISTSAITSPFLLGVSRPRIVLPANILADFQETELRAVLTHELMHWQRRDTWIGWLQVLVQGVFWFHPFLWWANRQLRQQREYACDEAVLRLGDITPENYGEAVVRVLTSSRGRSLVAGSLVGVFERGEQLQERLENIMNYRTHQRRFDWSSRLALAAFALIFLPMALAIPAADTAYPQIVKSNPANGATGVDPGLKEITVTFDRDMANGMSWTGGPPEFPPLDDSRMAKWKDKRTCVLPVKLAKGEYYRVGINSSMHTNFKSATGVAALPSSIAFTTKGASKEVESQLRAPEIVKLEPNNGAMDVDPQTDGLKVTFNTPMSAGASWTGGGSSFPKIPDGKQPVWSDDGLTCTLPVTLEPGHDYQLGLNSQSHINFQSKGGVPLKPVVYRFRTR